MTTESPASKQELEVALDNLVQQAYRNGVEVADGSYELIHQNETIPDWDLTIIRLK
jgi:hypothetical protein